MSSCDSTVYAVALFPGTGEEIREVRVAVVDMFGAPSLAEAIGAVVAECDSKGVPYAGRAWSFVAVQRLIPARLDTATGRRIISATELAEKRAAFGARLAAGNPSAAWSHRRKPRLAPDPQEPDAVGWAAEHEARQEKAA